MAQRRKLSLGAEAKNSWRVLRHPALAARLITLEGAKLCFDALNPRAHGGQAGRIRTVVVRPTDLCNLRCRVCGQWGEHGYQFSRDIGSFKENEVPLRDK